MTELISALPPGVPWAALTAVIWLAAYLVRRYLPNLWELPANIPFGTSDLAPTVKLARKVWQGLPSVLAGALAGAYMMGQDPARAWKGALAGALAPIWHEFLKGLPGPYTGSSAPPPAGSAGLPEIPPPPRLPTLALAFALVLGCSSLPPVPSAGELRAACPPAFLVASVECPAMALERCGDAATLAECPAADELRADCRARIQEELDKCQ